MERMTIPHDRMQMVVTVFVAVIGLAFALALFFLMVRAS
jgi:hypothetical protein